MKPKLKSSTSRKSIHSLSERQRVRVMSEVRRNLRFWKRNTFAGDIVKTCNMHNMSDSLIVDSDRSANVNHICDDMTIDNDDLYFSSICNADDTLSSLFNTTLRVSSFHKHLASCFVNNDLTHIQGNNILHLLRTHSCFSTLPKDVRTFLNTPRNDIVVSTVEPGEYIHFDLEESINQCLTRISPIPVIVNHLEIDFNTDGCTLYKSGIIHIWPIQIRIANIQHTRPIVIGIYKGTQKPLDPNAFFDKFVIDIRRIMSNGGIFFHDKQIPLRLRCFIADAPARAFILNHRSHMSTYPCSKCTVSGTRSEGRNVFNGVSHKLRTDDEYIKCLDEEHHKDGKSPLSNLPIGMVSQVPLEYMHLVCLGVMKKLLSAWIFGKFSRLSKLSGASISLMSTRINILKKYCPLDFARRPKSLDMCSKYKATEFRQFLLYISPTVTYDILNKEIYKHFLLLHAAMRILISNSQSERHLKFAELALQKFVLRCENLYGSNFSTYNVHGLLHLTNDVRHFGNLDSFSAFTYENNMSIFRKYCRKPDRLLQQFFCRIAEIEVYGRNDNCEIDSSIKVSIQHGAAGECSQFRKIMFNRLLYTVRKCNA